MPSVKRAAEALSAYDFNIGPEEVFDGEGTKEIYVGLDKGNSLLLMEGFKPGAYQRAMQKRGPGLHHLAIDVQNLEGYIESLGGSGWLLHPKSIKTMKQSKTAYLARPGFPALIEVQERKELDDRALFVESISLKMDSGMQGLINSIGLGIVKATSAPTELVLGGKSIPLAKLIN